MIKKIVLFMVLFCLILSGCTSAYKAEFVEESMTVTVGEVFSPEVTIKPGRFEYVLYSGNNSILQVDGTSVTALQTGIATLTVECGEKRDEITVYVLSDKENGVNGPSFSDPAYITFSIINYASAQLETNVLRVLQTVAGTDITASFPTLTGYSLEWFLDEDGTEPIPQSVVALKGEKTYYGVAKELTNNVLTDENGRVTGLVYPNLRHNVLVFPDSYNGTEITGIADYAFYGDTTLETVVIPRTYTYIGKFAFAGCTSLSMVRFAEGSLLTEIGDFAFGPTYTEPEEEEEEEEEDDTLAYLDSLLDIVGLTQLTTKKDKEEEEEIVINEDYCSSLDVTLPASLKTIGSYAFYNCSSVDTVLPENLERIGYGAFRGSNITVADLKNVKEIAAYAFYDCKNLTEVINTEKVTSCGGFAFTGTPLYDNQIKEKKVAYAGSIVIGCYTGKERVTLKPNTTLIADYAMNSNKQENLTVYFNAGEKTIIGWQSFYVTGYRNDLSDFPIYSDSLFLVVGTGESAAYGSDNPLLRERFCEKVNLSVNEIGATNCGFHTLLKLSSGKYVYDTFTAKTSDGKEVPPTEIDLSALPYGQNIIRVNSYAFESIKSLTTLRLGKVETVAEQAVSDCKNLTLIDLTDAVVIPTLLSTISFQFSTLSSDCIVLVTKSNYNAFYSNWESRRTAQSKLRCKKTIKLYVNGELYLSKEFLLPYEGTIDETFSTWYTDRECTKICEIITLEVDALYTK